MVNPKGFVKVSREGYSTIRWIDRARVARYRRFSVSFHDSKTSKDWREGETDTW